MRSRIHAILALSPLPWPLRVVVYVLVGVAVGLAVVTGRLANATSYLCDASETCMNCHVMTDAYATWQRGSHSRVTVCVDCHLPHNNPVANLAVKAADGMKDSYLFIMRPQPQVLRLSERRVRVVQGNCVRCHADMFAMIRLAPSSERRCWDCHSNIHGSVRSLSGSPAELRPPLPSAALDWLKKETKP